MLLLKPPQMVRLLCSQPLKHPPAAATFGFLRSIRVKRIAAAFDGEREFERVADDGGFEALLFVGGFEFPLLPEAGLRCRRSRSRCTAHRIRIHRSLAE